MAMVVELTQEDVQFSANEIGVKRAGASGEQYGDAAQQREKSNCIAKMEVCPESPLVPTHSMEGPYEFIYYDLETTGFGNEAEICQVAAEYDDSKFSIYILPSKEISYPAFKVNRLFVHNEELYYNNTLVNSVSLKEGLVQFLIFLEGVGKKVVLVAHNMFNFDARCTLSSIEKCGLEERFCSVVYGFLDSWPMLKKVWPERKSYKLVELAKDHLSEEVGDAHNASYDVKILRCIVEKAEVNRETLMKFTMSVQEYKDRASKKKLFEENKSSLVCMKKCGVSSVMINKMASCGMSLETLKTTFLESGEEGICDLLCESIDGKPKITKNKKIISCIVEYLQHAMMNM